MRKALEHDKMAQHHAEKADGLAQQLERSIFSDDPDAIEALEAKAAALEARRGRMKAINKAWKKAGSPKLQDSTPEQWAAFEELAKLTPEEAQSLRRTKQVEHYYPRPFAPYALTNIGATIRTAKKRIEDVKRRQARQARAEAAGGVEIVQSEDGAQITFTEAPPRELRDALKAAGFHYSGGSWFAYRHGGVEIPADVTDYAGATAQ